MNVVIEEMTDAVRAEVGKDRARVLKEKTEEIRALVKAEFGATLELGQKLDDLMNGTWQQLYKDDPVCKQLCEERKAQKRKPPRESELLAGYLERQGIVSLTRSRIEQLVQAVGLVRTIKRLLATRVADRSLPQSEGQIRPLVRLNATDSLKAELWQDAVKLANGRVVTKGHVEAAIAACGNCRPVRSPMQWSADREALRFLRVHTVAEATQLILALQKGIQAK